MAPETIILYGPPGTGKTTALMEYLKEEIEINKVKPAEIAFVSFTRQGAEQGKRSVEKAFTNARGEKGYSRRDFPYFRTLHSLAFKILNIQEERLMNDKRYREFGELINMNFAGYAGGEFSHPDDRYMFFDELFRNNKRAAKMYFEGLDERRLRFVRKNYAIYKKYYDLVDYTDTIKEFCDMDPPVHIPVRVAFVDEGQDLSSLQWEMVWKAFSNCERIYIAGDDDQAIYQWSGADVEHFMAIKGKTRVLHHSYRLPDTILAYSKRISARISHRVDKQYEASGQLGEVIMLNDARHVPIHKNESYLFLSRNTCFLDPIRTHLESQMQVYNYRDSCSVSKTEFATIKAYEKFQRHEPLNLREDVILQRALKKNFSLEDPWYMSFDWANQRLVYLLSVYTKSKILPQKPLIRLSTIHSVKGAEADNVVLLLDVTKTVYKNIQDHPDAEHRVFYVGATRAKKRLFIIQSSSKYGYDI